jgi:hypothetical protein
MTTVNMIAPPGGALNIEVNGRSYVAPDHVTAVSVPDFDASALAANGWVPVQTALTGGGLLAYGVNLVNDDSTYTLPPAIKGQTVIVIMGGSGASSEAEPGPGDLCNGEPATYDTVDLVNPLTYFSSPANGEWLTNAEFD